MGKQQNKALKPVTRAADGKLLGGTPNPGGITKEQRAARDALNLWLCAEPQMEKGRAAYLRCLEDGNPVIVKDYMDRVAGKVKDVVEHQGEGPNLLADVTREVILKLAAGGNPDA